MNSKVWLDTLLLLEQLSCLSFVLCHLFLRFILHLLVDLNLVFGHLDVFLHDADLLIFLGTLETELEAIRVSWSLFLLSLTLLLLNVCINFFIFKPLIHHLICLQINLVLLIELHLKAANVGNILQDISIQE